MLQVSAVRFVGIAPTTGSTFLGTRSFLHIKSVHFDHEDVYDCEATNEAGTDLVTFSLTVNRKSRVTFIKFK